MAAASDPAGALFTVRVSDEGGRLVVWAAGELDLTVSPVLDAALAGVPAAPGQLLTVDLSQLGFLDADGIRVLIEADERRRGAGQPGLTVRGAAGIVRRIFEVVRVTRLLSFPPD